MPENTVRTWPQGPEAEDKVEQFRMRENLFNFKEVTEYPKLDDL